MKIYDTEWKELAKYLAMNMDADQVNQLGMNRLILVRKFNRGLRPGITSKEAKAKNVEEDNSKWEFPYPDAEPQDYEIRRLVAYAIKIAIEVVFNNYLYSFAGQTYRQAKGGPIGSRLTMAVSRVLMGRWSHRVRKIMKESGLEIYLLTGYVDDVRLVVEYLDNGWTWDNKASKFQMREDKML